MQGLHFLDAGLLDGLQHVRADFVVGIGQQLAGGGIHHVVRQGLAQDVVGWHDQAGHTGGIEFTDVARGDTATGFHDHLALGLDVEAGGLAAQALGNQVQLHLTLAEMEGVGFEEHGEHLLGVIAKCAQQDTGRQLAAPVDAYEQVVLGIKLEIQPGTAIRNHAGGEQQFPGGMGLALVMVEEHARRTMQLRDDDALGAIHHEGTILGHERHFAHVHFLFLDVLDGLGAGRRILVIDDQAHQGTQGRGIGEATQLTLLDIKARLTQPIAHIIQGGGAGITGNGEHRLEGRMQPPVLAIPGPALRLQKVAIGIQLRGEQVGDLQNARALAEILTDAFFLGEAIGHGCSSFTKAKQSRIAGSIRPIPGAGGGTDPNSRLPKKSGSGETGKGR